MAQITEEQIEQIGQLAETADNLVAASKLRLPTAMIAEQSIIGLRGLVKELRALVVTLSGEDPWEMPPS